MSDDLERRLDSFYRGLDDSAQRVEGRWKARPQSRAPSRVPWGIAGAVAAAAGVRIVALVAHTHAGRQHELAAAAAARPRAARVVKPTLADARFVLLSPKSVVEFRPEEKRLTRAFDAGDLHAELIGPGR